MSFLNPLFLAAAAALAVPFFLHLVHRRSGRRHEFPALRYLRRTERDHARRIRLRQILLLLVRTAVILLLVAAGARLFLAGRGTDHPPTAVAIVIDNSLSSGVVVDGERLLDRLKEVAAAGLEDATSEDRIWLLRAGEPWHVPRPLTPAEALDAIAETEPRGATQELLPTIDRARSLAGAAGLAAAEVHVLGDFQPGTLGEGVPGARGGDAVPVLAFSPDDPPPTNRYLADLGVGGGLPPLVDQPTEFTARVDRSPPVDDDTSDTVRVRLVVAGRTAAVADAPLGSTVVLPAGPFSSRSVTGAVEIDPDALRDDDRLHFTFRVRPPPTVAVVGDPGRFVREAISVLADAQRLRDVAPGEAEVLIVSSDVEGWSADPPTSETPVVVIPPRDPALLPAANRWLGDAGIQWRYESDPLTGETGLEAVDLPIAVDEVRVRSAYRLVPSGDDPAGTRARRTSGEPWIVTGTTPEGRSFLLVGSPLRPDDTTLPLSAEMIPLVEWMVSGWSPTFEVESAMSVGDALRVPAAADAVRLPDGTLQAVDGSAVFRATGRPGVYSMVAGDSVLERTAVNPPPGESRLERIGVDEVLRRIPPPVQAVSNRDAWSSRVFVERRGHEPWRPLLLAAFLLLLGEGLLATGGGSSGANERRNERTETRRAGAT